jgi:hypothetical protein
MNDPMDVLADAEALVHRLKRREIERLVDDCERSEDRTLRSLAQTYRMLNFGPYR